MWPITFSLRASSSHRVLLTVFEPLPRDAHFICLLNYYSFFPLQIEMHFQQHHLISFFFSSTDHHSAGETLWLIVNVWL